MFPQAIYQRHEFAEVADFLQSHQQALCDEFMEGHDTLKSAISEYSYPSMDKTHLGQPIYRTDWIVKTKDANTGKFITNVKSWNSVTFRGTVSSYDNGFVIPSYDPRSIRYPTAYKITTYFGDMCGASQYSSFAPDTKLIRHTDPENREGRFLRIHVPLIIPKGNVFLEVNGEKVEWSDIFGFNNQLMHSSYNESDDYRLLFLIDIDREYLGLPKGEPWNPRWEKFARQFRDVT